METTNTAIMKADTRKTSSLVKKYLKETYGITVSVRSESYSGGSSINISYKLGVDRKKIESFINGSQYGSFNGMEDIYEYSNSKAPVLYGYELETFKFAFVRQEISRELKEKLYQLYLPISCENDLDYQKEQAFSRNFQVKNFVTQNEEEITLIKAQFNYDSQDLEFIYSVNGVQYNTKSLKPLN